MAHAARHESFRFQRARLRALYAVSFAHPRRHGVQYRPQHVGHARGVRIRFRTKHKADGELNGNRAQPAEIIRHADAGHDVGENVSFWIFFAHDGTNGRGHVVAANHHVRKAERGKRLCNANLYVLLNHLRILPPFVISGKGVA